MPELPEVELYRRYVEAHALRHRITAVRVLDRRILRGVTAPALDRALRGRRLVSTRRHGKHLFVEVEESAWLYLHFGMTGDLRYYAGSDAPPRFAKVVIDFVRDRHLAFEDARLFGFVDLVSSPDDVIEAKGLGLDALSGGFTFAAFRHALRRRRGGIKAVLMSQNVVAGLGNLYVDETLYQTSIAPRRAVDRLTDQEVRALYRAVKRVLAVVIERQEKGRPLPPSYLTEHREKGEPCPRCGGTLLREEVFGRTTFWCSRHQR